MCYWHSGRKEGQFPSGLGKRGRFKGTAINTKQGGFNWEPTANAVEVANNEEPQTSTFMTNLIAKVLQSSPLSIITVPNNTPSTSFDETTNQGHDVQGVQVNSSRPGKDPIILSTSRENKPEMLTFIDSSATNHCFVDRTIFTTYVLFEKPLASLSAGSSFDIVGKGSISFSTTIDEVIRIININNVLHTLSFQSNLISMLKLIDKGANVNFNKNGTVIKLQTSE